MGDFNEHLLFGFFFASAIGFFLKDFLVLEPLTAFVAAMGIVVGSLLPDIDHENSYVHRSVKAFTSISAGLGAFFVLPGSLQQRYLAAIVLLLVVYGGFSLLKIRHRGFTHSISFAVTVSAVVTTLSLFFLFSAAPGIALGLGMLSHLLLDGELKLS